MENILKMRQYKRNTSVDCDGDMSGDECTETFQDFVYHAEKEDRLVKGIFESAHVLEICPEVVDICILPSEKSQNIATHIQHKLIKAYCWENDIQILEADQTDFYNMIKVQRNKSVDSASVECVLVTSKPIKEIEMDDFDDIIDENIG